MWHHAWVARRLRQSINKDSDNETRYITNTGTLTVNLTRHNRLLACSDSQSDIPLVEETAFN